MDNDRAAMSRGWRFLSPELVGKRLERLKEAVPGVALGQRLVTCAVIAVILVTIVGNAWAEVVYLMAPPPADTLRLGPVTSRWQQLFSFDSALDCERGRIRAIEDLKRRSAGNEPDACAAIERRVHEADAGGDIIGKPGGRRKRAFRDIPNLSLSKRLPTRSGAHPRSMATMLSLGGGRPRLPQTGGRTGSRC
jgi:hypothetical protein